MAITLKVTPEELKSVSGELSGQGSTLKGYTDQMVSLIGQLSGDVWSGEAATSYINQFNGLQDDMDKIYRMVQEHVDDLVTIADTYIAAEQANQEAAASLSQDVIV